jgi:CheY-like chemotaxis protein
MSVTLNIVVIDDNSTNRILPGLFLRPLGHAVNECVGAEEALEWQQNNPCDVI